MDKLQSIKQCIDDQLNDVSDKLDQRYTKAWLEGFVCGATDKILHNVPMSIRDEALAYLKTQYDKKQRQSLTVVE